MGFLISSKPGTCFAQRCSGICNLGLGAWGGAKRPQICCAAKSKPTCQSDEQLILSSRISIQRFSSVDTESHGRSNYLGQHPCTSPAPTRNCLNHQAKRFSRFNHGVAVETLPRKVESFDLKPRVVFRLIMDQNLLLHCRAVNPCRQVVAYCNPATLPETRDPKPLVLNPSLCSKPYMYRKPYNSDQAGIAGSAAGGATGLDACACSDVCAASASCVTSSGSSAPAVTAMPAVSHATAKHRGGPPEARVHQHCRP